MSRSESIFEDEFPAALITLINMRIWLKVFLARPKKRFLVQDTTKDVQILEQTSPLSLACRDVRFP